MKSVVEPSLLHVQISKNVLAGMVGILQPWFFGLFLLLVLVLLEQFFLLLLSIIIIFLRV